MTNYVLPNRVGYIDYIQNKFHPNKIEEIKHQSKSFEHQILIDKYLDINSPYRGLLLYHELGTGKTATSITLVNQYLRANKKIYVILPASLRNNYIKELLIHSDFKKYKYIKKWSFTTGDAQLSETGKTYRDCNETEKTEIDKSIKKIILNRINFIHYNGLTETKVAELRGKINIKQFTEYLHKVTWKRVYGLGLKEIKAKFGIDATGNFYTDKNIKKKYVLLPNLVKGLETNDIHENDKVNIETMIKVIKSKSLLFIDTLKLKEFNVFDSAFSDSLVVIDEAHTFIRTVSNKSKLSAPLYEYIMNAKKCKILLLSGTPIINNPYEILHLCNLLRGPIITYKLPNNTDLTKYKKYIDTIDNNIIQFLPENFVKTKDNYIHYEEWKLSDILRKISDTKIKTITDYAFPPNEELFKKYFYNYINGVHCDYIRTDVFKRRIMGLVSFVDKNKTGFPEESGLLVKYAYLSNPQFERLLEKLIIEDNIEQKSKLKKNIKKNADESSVYKTYSRAVSNFSFPEGIIRSFPAEFNKMLTEYDDDLKYEGENYYDKHLADIKQKFINKVSKIEDIQERNNLLQDCSAKYMEMIKDIDITNGKVLVYSQFRTLEGVGMLSVYLDLFGFGKVEVSNTTVTIPDNKYNYMIYDLDKDIADKQIKLFNSADNIRGEKIKILIITLSGAEGISLSCVRSVLMLEPHWNMTILKQVIGRAVRNNSHSKLEPEERYVKTYLYLTTATESQKTNETFRMKHKSKTTDEVIFEKAELKQKNIDKLLSLMKESAFDCNIHAKKNGLDCYKWAYNLDKNLEAYKPNIDDEIKHMAHMNYEKTQDIKGKLVTKNDIKCVEYKGKYYDYNAYVDSKQLIPINFDLFKSKLDYKQAKDLKEPSKEPAKDPSKEPAKDPSKQAKDPSKEPAKEPSKEPAKEPAKDPSKDPSNSPKEPPKDPSKDSSKQAKEPAKEPPKEPSKESKDSSKDSSKQIQSPTAIKDNFAITIDPNDKLYDPSYNKKYKVVDVDGDGSCFYRAIYVVLKHKRNIMKFIKCFNLRSGLKETITEEEFVKWLRTDTLATKTNKGNDKNQSKNTYANLKDLPMDTYRTYIDGTWQIKELKNKPKSLTEFRKIIAEYISDTTKYANQYDKDLIDAFIEGVFKINVIQTLPELDYNFEDNTIYLLRINNNHYQAILVI